MSEFEVKKKGNDSARSTGKQPKQFEFKYVEKHKLEKIMEKVKRDKKKEEEEETKTSPKSANRTSLDSPKGKEAKAKVDTPTRKSKTSPRTIDKDLQALIEKARSKIKENKQMQRKAKEEYSKQAENGVGPLLGGSKVKGNSAEVDEMKKRSMEFPRSHKEILDLQMQQSMKEMQEIEKVHLSMLRQSKVDIDFEEFEESASRLAAEIEKGETNIESTEKKAKTKGVIKTEDATNSNEAKEHQKSEKVQESDEEDSHNEPSQDTIKCIRSKDDKNQKAEPKWVEIMQPSNLDGSTVSTEQGNISMIGSYDQILLQRYREYQQQLQLNMSQQCPINETEQHLSHEKGPFPDPNYEVNPEHAYSAGYGSVYANHACNMQQPSQPEHFHEDSDLEYEMQKRPTYTMHCYPRPEVDEGADTPAEGGHAEFVNVENQPNTCAMNLCYLVNQAPMRFTDHSDDVSEVYAKEKSKTKGILKQKRKEAEANSGTEVSNEKTPRKKPKKTPRTSDNESEGILSPKESAKASTKADDDIEERKEQPKGSKDRLKKQKEKILKDLKELKEAKETKDLKEQKSESHKQDLEEIYEFKEFRELRRGKGKVVRRLVATTVKEVEAAKSSVVDTPKTPKVAANKKETSAKKKGGIPVIECNMDDHSPRIDQLSRLEKTPRSQRTPRSDRSQKSGKSNASIKSKKQEIVQICQFVTDAMKLEKMKVYKRISTFQETLIEILDKLKMSLVELHTINVTHKTSSYKSTLDFAVQFTRNFLLPLRTMVLDAQKLDSKAYTLNKSNTPCNRIINIYKLIIQAINSYQKHLRFFCIDQIPNKLVSLLEYLYDVTMLTIQKGIFEKDDIVIDCLIQRCSKFVDFINEIIEERMVSARSGHRSPTKSIQSHYFTKKTKEQINSLEMYEPKVLKEQPPSTRSKRSKWLMSGKDLNRDSKTEIIPEIDPEEDAVPFDDEVETQVGNIKQASSGNESLGILNNLLLSASCNLLNDKKLTDVTGEALNSALVEALQNATKTQVVKMLEPYLQMLDTAVSKKK